MLFSRIAFTSVLALVAKTDAAPATDIDARLNKLSPKLDEVAKLDMNDTKHELKHDDSWYVELDLTLVPYNSTYYGGSLLTDIWAFGCGDEKCYCKPHCRTVGGDCNEDHRLKFYVEGDIKNVGCSFTVGPSGGPRYHGTNVCTITVNVPTSKHNSMTCSCTDKWTFSHTTISNCGLPYHGHQFNKLMTLKAPVCTICQYDDSDHCLTNGNECSNPDEPNTPQNEEQCNAKGGIWCPHLPDN